MKKFFKENLKNFWFWLFIAIAVSSAIIMPIMSLDAGNSGDEDTFQIPQAENVINWFKTDGADTTCMNFKSNMQYYGSSFDVIAAFISHTFHIDEIHTVRHICNAVLGWVAILTVGLIGYLCGGFRAGCFAMILLFFSPRFLGHSFNNPKDLPFATAVIATIFGIMLFFKQFPKVKWYTYIILTLSIAFAISVRIGGLILFGFFGLLGLMALIKRYFEQRKAPNIKTNGKQQNDMPFGKYFSKMVLTALAICIIGYFAGLLLWPYALQSPVKHPIEAFKLMSSFSTSLRQLFEGSLQWSDMLPWYYTPKYILTTIPIAVIAGVVLFFIFCWRKKEDRFWAFFVFFTFFFPVFWIVFTRANVYGGWRHAMFAYPPMVVAAGWGIDELVKWIEKKLKINNEESIVNNDVDDSRANMHIGSTKGIIVNIAALAVLLATLIGPIRHIIANHPYEYVYFNAFVGGMDGAYGQYEMDYYYHSTREASEWVIANAPQKADGSKTIVATWHSSSVGYFFRNDTARFTPRFCRWHEKGNSDWDYAIFTVTGMQPEQITNAAAFPPPDCVHTIDVDGKPICIILKRESKTDLLGSQYKAKGNIDSAIICLKQALAINPYNEAAINNLIECYFMTGKQDSAKLYIDHELTFLPKDNSANYYLLHYYLSKGDVEQAKKTCKFMIECNPKFTGAYSILSDIYLRTNDINNAKKTLTHLIDIDQLDNQCMQKLINIYKAEGFDDRGAYRKMYKTIYESLEKRGKKKEAEVYKDLYQQLK
ncbi:MAG: tetratricopeptide repeat protein [Bacteroidales bacterium]|nr:tetratricopeptide repeat protein [Bacteroidales bacterium]